LWQQVETVRSQLRHLSEAPLDRSIDSFICAGYFWRCSPSAIARGRIRSLAFSKQAREKRSAAQAKYERLAALT
jgi:hypothetical protein